MAALLTALSWTLLSGCWVFPNFGGSTTSPDPVAPTVQAKQVRAAQMPKAESLASYYCRQLGIPFICSFFGPEPTQQELAFVFDLELEFANPNQIPVPIVSALVALEAFPDGQAQRLGATCVTFCEDPNQCQRSADACMEESESSMIRDANDFANAAVGFLIDVARGERRFEDLRIRTVQPNDRLSVVIRLALAPTQMLELIRTLIGDLQQRLQRREALALEIPFNISGSAWIQIEGFGRLGASFGPFHDKFDILEEARR